MKRGAKILATIVGFVATLALAGCTDNWTWHQKLTVTVETPHGEVSGSSVQKVSWRDEKFVPGQPGGRAVNSLRGEATVIDLGGGRFLFALLGGMDTLAQYVVLGPEAIRAPMAERGEQLEQVGRSGEVPRERYPLMVTFDDIADPKTVRRVDPDDLAASFGPGTRLQSVTLEITDEPVTEGKVEQVLGWLTWPRVKLLEAGGGENPVKFSADEKIYYLGKSKFVQR